MLYIQHWKFKPGYHKKGAEKFLATGAPYAGAEIEAQSSNAEVRVLSEHPRYE